MSASRPSRSLPSGRVTDLLTHDEAAARLKVCAKTLRRLRTEGLIPYVAVTTRKIFYRSEDCDAFLASCVTVAVPSLATRRKSTRRGQKHSNVLSFMAGREARLAGRGR